MYMYLLHICTCIDEIYVHVFIIYMYMYEALIEWDKEQAEWDIFILQIGMAKYKLSKKRNRLNKEKDGLWYAEPSRASRMSKREVCRKATRYTTLSHLELEMGLEMLGDRLPQWLGDGYIVQLGPLGTLMLEYGSEGVKEPEDFDYRLIRKPRVVFRPSHKLTQAVLRAVSFKLDGLKADGVSFATVDSYRRWQETRQREKGSLEGNQSE